ncbi:MAG: FtsX-like permease family protein [Planctomycetota bacterium]
MSLLRLILASLWYHSRVHVAVALAVATGAAVLTGALVVGDSMRGSLRELAIRRLGHVEFLLRPGGWFREELATELSQRAGYADRFAPAVPLISLIAALELPDDGLRAAQVQLFGINAQFVAAGVGNPAEDLGVREIALASTLAAELGVRPGDDIIVRIAKPSAIPPDSALGRKRDAIVSLRLTVSTVLAGESDDFSLRTDQRPPRNAFMRLDELAQAVDRSGEVNTILVPRPRNGPASADDLSWLMKSLRPAPQDYGLRIEAVSQGFVDVTTDQMVLSPHMEATIREAAAGNSIVPVFTYLANTLACGDRSVPYSTVTAIDFPPDPPLGPWHDVNGRPLPALNPDDIVLNEWTAEQLAATTGDTIRVTYFDPLNTSSEHTHDFTLVAVLPLQWPVADRRWTPAVPGVTDQLTMSNWDPPFPFDIARIRPEDDEYWEEHGPTPKAFVSLEAGRKLWGSRFGETTSLRIVPGDGSASALAAKLADTLSELPARMGLVFQPVREQALAASVGTTPFEALFLGFSMFLIASAAILVALVFRLTVERRAAELGVLLSVGFAPGRLGAILLGEAFVVALAGSAVGVPLGVGYAALMLHGLRTWWHDAVNTSQLQLHVTGRALGIGLVAGVVVALLAMLGTIRSARRQAPRQLLAGAFGPPAAARRRRGWLAISTAAGLFIAAILLAGYAAARGGATQVPAFFGAGALVLLGGIFAIAALLRHAGAGGIIRPGNQALPRFAWRNAARHPLRSSATAGLIAVAVFLVTAVAAFRVDPQQILRGRDSSTGGYDVYAEASQPFFQSPATAAGREELGFSAADDASLASVDVITLRAVPGDDASCLNLYQVRRPRIVGLPKQFLDRGGFAWTVVPPGLENPWDVLRQPVAHDSDGTPLVPVVMEQATANYALHLWKGIGERYEVQDDQGRTIRFVVAGLLGPSLFQGDLLVSEHALLQAFPNTSGYRILLAEARGAPPAAVESAMERGLGDYGLLAESTQRRVARFLTVQNTYLATFQSLGGLGLLLGTFGLAALQLRNVWQRRRELGLLAAVGFRPAAIMALLTFETLWLLVAGLGTGLLAAVIAMAPQLGATIPWVWIFGVSGSVLVVGVVAAIAAALRLRKVNLLSELRRE